MPKDEAEQGGADARDIATPENALSRLRESEDRALEQRSRRLGRAAVEVSGAVGYRKLTVALIVERAGDSRTGFYKRFANKGDCYLAGYGVGIEELGDRLLERGRSGADWAGGLGAALDHLADFLTREPDYAAGLLAQVHVAGGAASARRNEVSERLSHALDGARREIPESRHSPPPIAAAFIVSAIEQSVIGALGRGAPEEFAAAIPALLHLAVSTYFGPEAAEGPGQS